MRSSWIPVVLAASFLACGRDLEVPAQNTLVLADPFPSVAPREALTIGASGGSLPYTFSFAPGGPASGPDATIDTATGAYVAGSIGPVVDVVQVRDAGGATREARISVGPPLQVAPRTAFVAPGGRVSFAGAGGKPPYQLEVVSGVGSVQGTDYLAPASGGCTGTVSAPAQAQLRLRDATGAAPIDLAVSVGRGLDLFPAVGAGDVAPYEQIAFVASGGQPPYEFSMEEPVPSSGPGIDAGRGTYVAGPVGSVLDRVFVTDANGERRCFDVSVGPPLTVALSSADPRPGKEMRVLATGGRPPYAFSFAPKGNRSRATLDPVSGVYVPGRNALATDLLLVRDATGAPPVGPIPVTVGPLQAPSGAGSAGCLAGDIDGDGYPEAVSSALEWSSPLPTVPVSSTTVAFPRGAPPALASYNLGTGGREPVLVDLDGDGDQDLVHVIDGTVRVLRGGPDGRLAAGPTYAAGARGPLAVARGSRRVFAATSGTCNGVVALDLDAAGSAFLPPVCIATTARVDNLAAGDFDGDGAPDVAYHLQGITDRVTFRLGAGPTPYATTRDVLLPAPWRAEFTSIQTVNDMIEVRPDGATASGLAVIVIDAPRFSGTYRTGIAAFRGGAAGPVLDAVGLVQPGGAYNLMGIAAVGLRAGGRARVAGWNGTDGTTLLLDWPFAGSPPIASAVQPTPRAFRVGCVTAADFDGDGTEDLFIAPRDEGPRSEVLSGEWDGSYARKARFESRAGASYPAGDVDGDGLTDYVGASRDQGLEVLFSGPGLLAVSAETPLDGQLVGAAAADWDGDGVPDLVARIGATGLFLFRGNPARDGSFAPPVPVEVTDSLGNPMSLAPSSLRAADLGGAAPGPDILMFTRVDNTFRWGAVVFSSPTRAVAGIAPLAGFSEVVVDLDGDGVQDLVSTDGSGIRLTVALVKPADPPGATWPFRPWTPAGAYDAWIQVGRTSVAGAVPPRGRAFFLGTGGIVFVEAPGGAPVASLIPVAPGIIVDPMMAAIGDVTGDDLPDLVLSQYAPSPWLVFPGTADGLFAGTPRADLTFDSPAGAWFGLVPGALGVADLLVDVPGAIVVLENDGFGRFR